MLFSLASTAWRPSSYVISHITYDSVWAFLLKTAQLGWVLWHVVQNGMYPSRPNESKNAIERKLVSISAWIHLLGVGWELLNCEWLTFDVVIFEGA